MGGRLKVISVFILSVRAGEFYLLVAVVCYCNFGCLWVVKGMEKERYWFVLRFSLYTVLAARAI